MDQRIGPIKTIITDIEGTTTSISFVFDVLFPFFLENMDSLKVKEKDPLVISAFEQVIQTVWEEETKKLEPAEVYSYLYLWCKSDRKHPALKTLQGIVWSSAYENGLIQGDVYPDVSPNLALWNNEKIRLAVYSSGSVTAQKLLFGFSKDGNLNPYFDFNFDTAIGHKRQADSYQQILNQMHAEAAETLFLSDIEEELDAAKQVGIQTIKLIRPGTKEDSKHLMAKDFFEVDRLIFK